MLKVKTFKSIGRGLVSTTNIKRGTVIHVAEVIHLNKKDSRIVSKTLLDSYVYCLGHGTLGLALGLGSLFNHNPENNVDFAVKFKNGRYMIYYKAARDIKSNEQLFLDYGYEP